MPLSDPQPPAEQIATYFPRHHCGATLRGAAVSWVCHILCTAVLCYQAPRVAVHNVKVAVLPIVVPAECVKWRWQYVAAGVQAVRSAVVAVAAETVYASSEHRLAAVKSMFLFTVLRCIYFFSSIAGTLSFY